MCTRMCILFKITSSHLEVCVVSYRNLYFNITFKNCATSFTVSSELPQNWVTYMTQNSGKGFTEKKVKIQAFQGVSSEIRTADEFILPLGGRRDFTVLAITSYFHWSRLVTYVPAANSDSSFSRQTPAGWSQSGFASPWSITEPAVGKLLIIPQKLFSVRRGYEVRTS